MTMIDKFNNHESISINIGNVQLSLSSCLTILKVVSLITQMSR